MFILLCMNADISGQYYSTRSRKAIKLYEEAQWTNSPNRREDLLLKAIDKDDEFVEAYVLLARTYAMQDSMPKAIRTLENICAAGRPLYSEILFDIANYQYLSGEYEDALSSISKVDDMRYYNDIKQLKDLYKKAIYLKANPIPFKPRNLEMVNTVYDDYFPSITADGSMISTTVLMPAGDTYSTHEDIFASRLVNGQWSKSKPLSAAINTLNNEGAQTFSADGRYMFFISCGGQNSYGGCDIFYSIKQGDGWTKPMNLGTPANSEYWESNPVMCASGDKIYFTTNRPGGIGNRDIWSVDVKILNNGILKCSNARSLGRPINTEEGEWAPYIHADGETLYFSSNGHGGLGRNDIFMSRNIRGKWTIPMNLGYPINTHGDESGLTVSGDGTRAYFASNKLEGSKKLDIYEIDLPTNAQAKAMSSKIGIVVDAESYQPLQATVEIYDLKNNKRFFESVSDIANGTFCVSLPSKGTFGLSVKKSKYIYYRENIKEETDTIRVLLKQIKSGTTFNLQNIHFATDSDSLLIESDVEINRLCDFLRANPTIRIRVIGHTDNQGSSEHNKDLSQRRALALVKKLVKDKKISSKRMTYGGLGDTKPIASNDTEEGRARNRRVEVIIL